jgi:putative secretion ATPase (PEP-CTERM system associated)
MYESHFGLSGSPFQLNPDPAFYFDSRGHRNALAYLKFGAHQGEGFIVVTGEIGAGKTTLVRTLLGGLDPERVVAAQVVSTQLESGELLQAILMSFGIASASTSKAQLIGTLEAFLTSLAARGRRALLIIDEAQNLRHEAVEELRMLSNFQIGKFGLLQSFLVGQPELRQLLQSKSMEQLRQRVIASCHLGPLDLPETQAYIEHRLKLVGWVPGRPAFSEDAFASIHQWTGGVPRKINRLCNRLLLGAFLNNDDVVSADSVERTAGELRSEIGELSEVPERLDQAAVAAQQVQASSHDAGQAQAQAHALSDSSVGGARGQTEPVARLNVAKAVGARERSAVRLVQPATVTGTGPVVATSSVPASPPAPVRRAESPPEPVVPKEQPVQAQSPAATPGVAPVDPSPSVAPAPFAPTMSTPSLVRKVHRAVPLGHPVICLVDTAAELLQAGTLADGFRKVDKLPPVLALHLGADNKLALDDSFIEKLPTPAVSVHIGALPEGYSARMSHVLAAVEAVFDESPPAAVVAIGASDATLAAVLLARDRGVPVFRVSGGETKTTGAGSRQTNASLLNRLSKAIYLGRLDGYADLYEDNIKSDQALCVGKLAADTVKLALEHLPSAERSMANAVPPGGDAKRPANYAMLQLSEASWPSEPGACRGMGDLLCELSAVRPLLLPVSDALRLHLRTEGLEPRLKAAGIHVIRPLGYPEELALLKESSGLVLLGSSHLADEAAALQIPVLRLSVGGSDSGLSVFDETERRSLPASEAAPLFTRLLAGALPPPESPDYWDAGVALRIANHVASTLKLGGKH